MEEQKGLKSDDLAQQNIMSLSSHKRTLKRLMGKQETQEIYVYIKWPRSRPQTVVHCEPARKHKNTELKT